MGKAILPPCRLCCEVQRHVLFFTPVIKLNYTAIDANSIAIGHYGKSTLQVISTTTMFPPGRRSDRRRALSRDGAFGFARPSLEGGLPLLELSRPRRRSSCNSLGNLSRTNFSADPFPGGAISILNILADQFSTPYIRIKMSHEGRMLLVFAEQDKFGFAAHRSQPRVTSSDSLRPSLL